MYIGSKGTTISAVKDGSMFTIRIYDEENNQIGMFENIVDVPRGLILAEGYVAGYHAGIVEGNRCMYQSVCSAMNVEPNQQTLDNIGRECVPDTP